MPNFVIDLIHWNQLDDIITVLLPFAQLRALTSIALDLEKQTSNLNRLEQFFLKFQPLWNRMFNSDVNCYGEFKCYVRQTSLVGYRFNNIVSLSLPLLIEFLERLERNPDFVASPAKEESTN